MATAALLSQLLAYKSQLNHATMEQIFWTEKYDANQSQMTKFEKYQAAYDKAYDKAIGNSKEFTNYGITVKKDNQNEALAAKYAEAAIGFSQDYLEYMIEDLTDLDTEYDLRKTMLDTTITETNAAIDAIKQQTATEAQNTHLLQS